MSLHDPWLLLLLLPVIPLLLRAQRRTALPALRYPVLDAVRAVGPGRRVRWRWLLPAMRLAAAVLIVLALTRPQLGKAATQIFTEGIDIMLAVDVSGSMLAEDLKPNRIEAAKAVASEFVDGRPNDRIGLVVFAGESFTQCPMTLDHRVVKDLLRQIESGMVEDGTAIGLAIAQGVNRLKDGEAKSKVMILLTDGVNNRGEIDPLTATQIALSFGIRMYAIGVGTIIVIVLLGPAVDLASRRVRAFRLPAPSVAPAPVVCSECD